MSFQLKDQVSITASMLNWMRSVQTVITDFNIGGVVRSMLEACASEIDELYKQIFIGLIEAIPVSIYTSFSFPALAATPAGGLITAVFTAQSQDVLIAAGTLWVPTNGSGITYTQIADATLPATRTTLNISVSATTVGSAGNIPEGISFNPNPVPTGYASAANAVGFINGTDAETTDQQKIRFNAYISTLSRGTVAAITYGCTTTTLLDSGGNVTERVATAQVVEPWVTDNTQPVSLVNSYIYNGVGGTSGALVTQCQNVVNGYYDTTGNAVPGWKAAGVKCVVRAVTESPVNVTGVLSVAPGYSAVALSPAVNSAIFSYLQGLKPGQPFVLFQMLTAISAIQGVSDFVPSAPTGDSAGVVGVKYTPGAITIN